MGTWKNRNRSVISNRPKLLEREMVRWGRCCLHNSMRGVNLLVNLCGVAMIIYSLWLLKKWHLGIAELPTVLYFPKPWFIYACLGVGIAVCLSTLFGHIVASSPNGSILCIYIISICFLLVFEVAVVETTFFRINWDVQLSKYIDEHHTEFESFVIFHIRMCRVIVIVALVPQIYVIVLAIILWGVGAEPRSSHYSYMDIPDFRQSFLVGPNSPIPGISGQNYGNFVLNSPPHIPNYPRQISFLPYIYGVFRTRFLARTSVII